MGVFNVLGLVILVTTAATACSKTVNECSADSDCKDVAYPFCDVNGEFGPSGGEKNVCTIIPPDCPIERCGCSPGATTCDTSTLTVCNPDGKSVTSTMCALGCSTGANRCASFDPGFGLQAALAAASTQPDVTLVAGTKINTDTGVVTDGNNQTVTVPQVLVAQNAGADIRVYTAGNFTISDVTVSGSKPIAFVGGATVKITGTLRVRGSATIAGPGALEGGACVGNYDATGGIGGGAGNATAGGAGAGSVSMHDVVGGGTFQTDWTTLAGGCRGGGPTAGGGGGGGGAVALVALSSVSTVGTIDAGAGGGITADGGGSGGNVVLVANMVSISGSIATNGGGGGGCGMAGADGSTSYVAAAGGGPCSGPPNGHGGAGGTSKAGPGAATNTLSGTGSQSGGGGAVGRLLVRSTDAGFAPPVSALVSAALTVQTISIQ